MRRFSKEEKKLLKSFIKSEKETFGLMDFIGFNFPVGRFEISTFQQAISLQVTDEELPRVMNHLVNRLNLIKQLEKEGYLSLWAQLPIEDNTQSCGAASESAKTVFVPDISIASELLKYGNYQMSFSSSLVEWSKRNFSINTIPTGLKYTIYGLLIAFGVDLLYQFQIIGENIQSDHRTIVDNHKEVLENQKLNKQIIDSIQSQGSDLVYLTNRISTNTENMKDVELLMDQQRRSIISIQDQINSLEDQLVANHRLIRKTDSLLNLSNSNE